MALPTAYQLRTFADIVAAVREELKIQASDTTSIQRIQRNINIVYLDEVVPFSQWKWLRDQVNLTSFAYFTNGKATFSQNSNIVTLSIGPSTSKKGFYISPNGTSEIYKISEHTAGSTSLTISVPFNGTTIVNGSFKIWTDRIPLPTFCRETIEITNDYLNVPLENCGLQRFRQYVGTLPKAEGRPLYYTTNTYVDPGKYVAVSGLPAISTRASNGLTKTITFVTDVTNYFQQGDRIEITATSDFTYNGELQIDTVSGAIVTYTGLYPLQELAVVENAMSIKKSQSPSDSRRYKELTIYPSLYQFNTELHVDYLREVNALVNDADEPLIPISDRVVLLYGALASSWARERNPQEGQRNAALYGAKLERMAGKIDDSVDFPRMRVDKVYLGTKRNVQRYQDNTRGWPYGLSGGGTTSAGGGTVGTPNRAAVFDSTGTLIASISTLAEEAQLSGILSKAVGISDVNTLTNKTISGSNNTISGIAYSSLVLGGSIVNADVNASAAIAYSKLNLAGSIVNADVASAAAIAYSKLAALPSADILVGNASNVATAVAMSGDVAISNAGVTTVQSGAITASKIAVGTITNTQISSGAAIALSKLALLTPTVQKFTSGSGTYTTPTSPVPLYLKVRMVGGGGGGGGVGATTEPSGANGSTTTFNSVNANGGTGASTGNGPGGAGGTGGTGTATLRIAGGPGGTTTQISTAQFNGPGGSSQLGFGAAGNSNSVSVTGTSAAANTGGGGGGAIGTAATTDCGRPGGGGEYVELLIATPTTSYSYSVGGGGAGGIGTGTGAATGGAGGSGLIIVEEHYQ